MSLHDFSPRHSNELGDFNAKKERFHEFEPEAKKNSEDFAGENGTMVEAMVRPTSISDTSHVERNEDEDGNDGHRMWRKKLTHE